ncbi:MAG: hypothetical protein B6245_19515 [Desulfobacteraceae bacterium 4572_88]|nr:MAG: hypothetical protein B6245_19515 [Desulfobacteraceae bacterium 4572_88]
MQICQEIFSKQKQSLERWTNVDIHLRHQKREIPTKTENKENVVPKVKKDREKSCKMLISQPSDILKKI